MERHTPREIFDSTLKLLEEMTVISSPSGHLEGLQKAAEHFAEALGARGLSHEIRSQPDADGNLLPVLYARGPASRERYLLVVGHLDTVLSAAAPTRRDGRLYATGATDMKGGLAALVGALGVLAAEGSDAASDLLVAVVPDEEVGGRLTQEVVEVLGPGARGLWVLEPGRGGGDSETMVLGRRGMFQWRLDVEGRSAHAGNGYWDGRSALVAASQWCVEARGLSSPGYGPTVNAGRLVAGEHSFIEDLAGSAELVGTARQLNVVPDRAIVEGEARFRQSDEGERLAGELAELAERAATTHEVKTRFQHDSWVRPIFPSETSRRWAAEASRIAESGGWHLAVEDDRPGISFPNFLPEGADIPALDGLGPVGGGMHTRDEFVNLESLDRRIALLAELLKAVRDD